MLSFILNFTERWLGAFPRVVLAFLGVLICVLVISALWDRRMRISSALVGMLAGLSMVFHTVILRAVSSIQVDQRLRLFGIAVGLAILGITAQAVRRVNLQKPYAIIWFGAGIGLLLVSLNPGILRSLEGATGVQSLVLLGGACFLLLLLLVCHYSVVISRLEKKYSLFQERLVRLETTQNKAEERAENQQPAADGHRFISYFSLSALRNSTLFSAESVGRTIRGTRVGAPLVIIFAALAVLLVGLAAPQAMVGDEVTHYYMLVKQAQDISKPNFYSDIPMASGGVETRRYPHSFVWHYIGALVYLATGGSFIGVQLYQTFFLFQLLTVAYLLARSRGGVETRSALLYILVLASLPLCLIFSVAFYQDVPMTAQVLTAFYLLSRRCWFSASCFMALAIGFKVTAVLFFPAFFFLAFFWETRKGGFRKGTKALVCATIIVLGSTYALGKAINIYAQAAFYPQEKLEILISVVKNKLSGLLIGGDQQTVAQVVENQHIIPTKISREKTPETAPVIIANNPGDLRIKENYLVYGGLLIWLIFLAGVIASLPQIRPKNFPVATSSNLWLLGVGGSFLFMTAYLTKTAPDARFFLPGLPFILLPVVEKVVRLPKPKVIIILFASLALLQGGYVLNKAYRLRDVSPAIYAGIEYLKAHPPTPGTIFMYPEGNYRFFPVRHEWYLGYRLREFWRADNKKRIEMLQSFGIGAVVVKKQLIAEVDNEITNLGVYPTHFVDDLRKDPMFIKILENDDLLIFLLPGASIVKDNQL